MGMIGTQSYPFLAQQSELTCNYRNNANNRLSTLCTNPSDFDVSWVEPLFNSMVRSVKRVLMTDICSSVIECLFFEMLISESHLVLRKYEYKSFENTEFISLEINADVFNQVEEIFSRFYSMLHKHIPVWNKARFFFRPRELDYFFEYKFDSDLLWIQSMNPTGIEYQSLSFDIENKIIGWEGLPSNQFKPWVN